MLHLTSPGDDQRFLGSVLCFGALLLVSAGGCTTANRVTGKVTYDGRPLPAGRVSFLCDGGNRPLLTAKIDESGDYEIQNPPEGRVRVAVETFEPQPKPAPGPDPVTGIDYSLSWEDEGPYVPIPERYGSVQTSGIEAVISAGEQTLDITLVK